jgi:hypothetical protein
VGEFIIWSAGLNWGRLTRLKSTNDSQKRKVATEFSLSSWDADLEHLLLLNVTRSPGKSIPVFINRTCNNTASRKSYSWIRISILISQLSEVLSGPRCLTQRDWFNPLFCPLSLVWRTIICHLSGIRGRDQLKLVSLWLAMECVCNVLCRPWMPNGSRVGIRKMACKRGPSE